MSTSLETSRLPLATSMQSLDGLSAFSYHHPHIAFPLLGARSTDVYQSISGARPDPCQPISGLFAPSPRSISTAATINPGLRPLSIVPPPQPRSCIQSVDPSRDRLLVIEKEQNNNNPHSTTSPTSVTSDRSPTTTVSSSTESDSSISTSSRDHHVIVRNETVSKRRKDLVKDDAYWERRKKNNDAAKRSRDQRRQKEDEIAHRAANLEMENQRLQDEVEKLRSETDQLRGVLLSRQLAKVHRSASVLQAPIPINPSVLLASLHSLGGLQSLNSQSLGGLQSLSTASLPQSVITSTQAVPNILEAEPRRTVLVSHLTNA